MKTLYVSDLDGTLLQSNQTTSDFTCEAINRLVEKGMLFSYATARSRITATKVTRGLVARIPLVVYNGAFVADNISGELLLSNFFDRQAVVRLLDDLLRHGVYPMVYALFDGVEKLSYLEESSSDAVRKFLSTRKNDPRIRPVKDVQGLYEGDIFYITCIDEEEKLFPLFRKHRETHRCLFQRDIYSGEQWLEFLPHGASKSNAVRRLKELLDCDRLVVFGDGLNDLDLFRMADEAYAVENAVDEIKGLATGIIGSNDEDGVAKWLLENVLLPQE